MIRLDAAPGWAGWVVSRYGRAREWRLVSPRGENFTTAEIANLRHLVLDVDYLRGRVLELEGLVGAHACYFDDAEIAALQAAVAVLERRLPAPRRRRRFSLITTGQLRAV